MRLSFSPWASPVFVIEEKRDKRGCLGGGGGASGELSKELVRVRGVDAVKCRVRLEEAVAVVVKLLP